MPPDSAVSRPAYAKINLTLAVGPAVAGEPGPSNPRAGWHPIVSWIAAIDLADEIRIHRLPDAEPSMLGIAWAADAPMVSPIDWPPDRDLTFRAHAALERAVGRRLPAGISVTKRIPVGGGLGGGSSDAAATLLILNELFGLGLGAARLAEIGAGLGSDVPFFLDAAAPPGSGPAPAIVSGFGERLTRVGRSPAGIALIIPPFACPTAEVYRAFDRRPGGKTIPDVTMTEALAQSPLMPSSPLFNQLSEAAFDVRPELRAIHSEAERALRQPVHLTGSGSCLFAIMDQAGQWTDATRLREAVTSQPSGSRTTALATRLL